MILVLFLSSVFAASLASGTDEDDYASPPLSRYQKAVGSFQSVAAVPDPGSPDPQIAEVAAETAARLAQVQSSVDSELGKLHHQLVAAVLEKNAIEQERQKEQIARDLALKEMQSQEDASRQQLKAVYLEREQNLLSRLGMQDLAVQNLRDQIADEQLKTERARQSLERQKTCNESLEKKIKAVKASYSAVLAHAATEAMSTQVFLDDIKGFEVAYRAIINAYRQEHVECGGLETLMDRLVADADYFRITQDLQQRFKNGEPDVVAMFQEKKAAIKESARQMMRAFE